MDIPEYLLDSIEEGRTEVLALDSPEIIHEAKNIAFFNAMLDAALEDPLDDPDEQTMALNFFKKNIQDHVEKYQELVNEAL